MRHARYWVRHGLLLLSLLLLSVSLGFGLVENDKIGFTPNHVFESAIKGENVNLMNGNMTLQLPIGPRMQLSDSFGYQIQLYYNSKIWKNEGAIAYLPQSETYGAGVTMHFGRIYQVLSEPNYIYHYQTSSGADHVFCVGGTGYGCVTDNITLDPSSMRIETGAGGLWEVYPGDGTRIIFGHNADQYDPANVGGDGANAYGGYYATRIERLNWNSPAVHYYDINYLITDTQGNQNPTDDVGTDEIVSIVDSAGRTVSFTTTIDLFTSTTDIAFPGTGGTYTLGVTGSSFKDPTNTVSTNHNLLTSIIIPELDPINENFGFSYGWFGNLKKWTLPTGAVMHYTYAFYRGDIGQDGPFYTAIVAKELEVEPGGERYLWTYTRFGDALPDSAEGAADLGVLGETYSGSNPYQARVVDPFGNLTIYNFHSTPYGNNSCNQTGCTQQWTDGLMYWTGTYAGRVADPQHLIESQTTSYVSDGSWVSTNPQINGDNWSRSYWNTRPSGSVTHRPGAPSVTSVQSDWAHIYSNGNKNYTIPPMSKLSTLSSDGHVFRSTYTDLAPSAHYHNKHNYVETRDADGVPISRVDKQWNATGQVVCQLRRADPSSSSAFTCFDSNSDFIPPVDGSVKTANVYDPATGALQTQVTGGGDAGSPVTVHYEYEQGVLKKKWFGDLLWNVVDRTLDSDTGRVLATKDPSGVTTSYAWDTLGRLTLVDPEGAETPVTVTYPDVHNTSVVQLSGGTHFNSGRTESAYLYDTLGRVVEERRRSFEAQVGAGSAFDFRRTTYDSAGRVTGQSEWAAEGETNLAWTVTEYESPLTDENGVYYTDPKGRVSRVIRPDASETTTEYTPLTSSVTIHEIQGVTGLIDATTTYTNDVYGRLVGVDSPGDGADAAYIYDERDNLLEVQLRDPLLPDDPQLRRFSYDHLGRLRQATNPENGTVHYDAYDGSGNLTGYTDARGYVFENVYDILGRLTEKNATPLDSTTPRILAEYAYDVAEAEGKLSQTKSYGADDGALRVTTDFHYAPYDVAPSECAGSEGAFGTRGLNKRLAATVTTIVPWNAPLVTEYCYNDMGLTSGVLYPADASGAQSIVQMAYHNGRLSSVDDVGRDISYVRDVAYGPHGLPTTLIRGNDVIDEVVRDSMGRPLNIMVSEPLHTLQVPATPNAVWGCGQNQGGNMALDTCIPAPTPGAVQWSSSTYSYDLAGNVNQIGNNTYKYDELNRIVDAHVVSTEQPTITRQMGYIYDPFGNMLTRTKIPGFGLSKIQNFSVDVNTNRLTAETVDSSVTNYTYDDSGNMLSAGTDSYSFDALNRMTKVFRDNAGQAEFVAEYDYDVDGYRVRSETEDAESFFVRDGSGRLLSEYRRASGEDTELPVWNRDYIYGFGQQLTLLKNEQPQTPSLPWATDVTSSRLRVNWNEVEDPDVGRYRIYRGVNGAMPFQAGIASADSFLDTFGALVDSTDPTTVLSYTVVAEDSAANTSDSSPPLVVRPFDLVAPNAPTIDLTGTLALDEAVIVAWHAVTDDDLDGYLVERAIGNSGVWAEIGAVPPSVLSFYDANLVNAEDHYYRVRAIDTMSQVSSIQNPETEDTDFVILVPSDVMPPPIPDGLHAFPELLGNGVALAWVGLLNPDLGGYDIEIGAPDNEVSVGESAVGYVDAGASFSSPTSYRIRSFDTAGNRSDWSGSVASASRDVDLDAPDIVSIAFDPDENGTIGVPPSAPVSYCSTTEENDDIIGVSLVWEPTEFADAYRVYRSLGTDPVYHLIAEVDASDALACPEGNPDECHYFDGSTTHWEYTYHVVGVESGVEGPGQAPFTVVDVLDLPVREISLYDSRNSFDWDFETRKTQWVDVLWSRVPETTLAGYHVYRKCKWLTSNILNAEQLVDLTCTHSWVRVTDEPVQERVFRDATVGGLKGDFVWMVRPVAADGTEGPVSSRLALASLHFEGGANNNPHCDDVMWSELVDPEGKWHDYTTYAITRIESAQKGTEDPAGKPSTPIIIDRNDPAQGPLCIFSSSQVHPGNIPFVRNQPFCDAHESDSTFPPDQNNVRWDHEWVSNPNEVWVPSRLTRLAAYIDWLPVQDSDLVGYYVEMAGSMVGPWTRLNETPIAWWETHYDARLWHENYMCPLYTTCPEFLGPECAVFRLIAVDEDGNESDPSEPFDISPIPEVNEFWGNRHLAPSGDIVDEQSCGQLVPTLDAPTGLAAEDELSNNAVKISWDQVPGAHAYRVYRNVLREYSAYYFYITGTVLTSDSDCSDGACCDATECYFQEDGLDSTPDTTIPLGRHCPYADQKDCELGYLDAYYVTAIEDVLDPETDMPRESLRSDTILFQYYSSVVQLISPDGDEYPVMLASLGQSQPGPASWCEGSVEDWCEQRPLPTAMNRIADAHRTNAAPLVTLGQASPSYEILNLHVDHLGSTRVITNAQGTPESRHDFLPFGEEVLAVFSYNTKQFTGHERDKETGLDYMLARYYSSGRSRFLGVDPVGGVPGDPLSWNRFSYTRNNPINAFDPDGREAIFAHIDERQLASGKMGREKFQKRGDARGVGAMIGAVGFFSGVKALIVGAVVGAGSEAGVQIAKGEELNGKDIIAAAAGGAITGGVASLGATGQVIEKAAAGAAGAVLGGATNAGLDSDSNTNPADVGDAVVNAVAGGLGASVAAKADELVPLAAEAGRQVSKLPIVRNGIKSGVNAGVKAGVNAAGEALSRESQSDDK